MARNFGAITCLAALEGNAAAQQVQTLTASNTVVILRVGNSTYNASAVAPGTTLPVFVDYYSKNSSSAFTLNLTLSLPGNGGVGSNACTLPAGVTSRQLGGATIVRNHFLEGMLTGYFDPTIRLVGSWPCYAAVPGVSVLNATYNTTLGQLSGTWLNTALSLKLDDAPPGLRATGLLQSLSLDGGYSFLVSGATNASGFSVFKQGFLANRGSLRIFGGQSPQLATGLSLRSLTARSYESNYIYGLGTGNSSSGMVGVWQIDVTSSQCVAPGASYNSSCFSLLPGFNGTSFPSVADGTTGASGDPLTVDRNVSILAFYHVILCTLSPFL